ncbi:hypothetical protein AN216_02280 [Streptomyces oceani]|uniref:SH3b domain-containing protein n=1 Tax=Streptomyces oceani TaxID=1075402 RepID=A0A1E7KPJ0_9ACTN|nr:hypothetical protein AN216_02280 [Streptomyces oceani]
MALCAAGGAVAALTATGPALASDSSTPAPPAKQQQAEAPGATVDAAKRTYTGKVIARTGLNVRTGPSQNYRVIDTLEHGEYVQIKCKVNGQWIDGNPRWYKLADGKWAWASARYIKNIGPAPHWCR